MARLAARECSGQELMTYLLGKGIPEDIALETLDELAKDKSLDERRLAGAMARAHAAQGKGPGYLHAKLREKGVRIGLDEIRELYDEASGRSEIEAARALLARKYPHAREDDRELRRAYSALVRRGYSPEVIRELLGQLED